MTPTSKTLGRRNGITDAIDTKFQQEVQHVEKRRPMLEVSRLSEAPHHYFIDVLAMAPRPGARAVSPVADELAPVLRIAPQTASALVQLTRRLDGLPAAADTLAPGAAQ